MAGLLPRQIICGVALTGLVACGGGEQVADEDVALARAQIDAIDGELLALLAERSAHVDRVTVLKGQVGVAAAAVVASATNRSSGAGNSSIWAGRAGVIPARTTRIATKRQPSAGIATGRQSGP